MLQSSRLSVPVLLAALVGFSAAPHEAVARSRPLGVAHSPYTPIGPDEQGNLADAVVVVTIDGSRWQEVFRGVDPELGALARVATRTPVELLPTLTRWRTYDGAAVGAPGLSQMRASGPNFVSLPGYTELFTGRTARECQTNDCGAPAVDTLFDVVAERDGGDSVAVISSWESIGRVASARPDATFALSTGRTLARGLPRSWLASGQSSPAWPGSGDYRPDARTAELALTVLRERRPSLMFVGLGDTDERAHHGDYAGYLTALQAADRFLGDLETTLASMGARGERTAIVVTCDHGRSRNFRDHGGAWPESARTWLVAHGAGIARGGALGSASGWRGADVAPTIRRLLGLRDGVGDAFAGRAIDDLVESRDQLGAPRFALRMTK